MVSIMKNSKVKYHLNVFLKFMFSEKVKKKSNLSFIWPWTLMWQLSSQVVSWVEFQLEGDHQYFLICTWADNFQKKLAHIFSSILKKFARMIVSYEYFQDLKQTMELSRQTHLQWIFQTVISATWPYFPQLPDWTILVNQIVIITGPDPILMSV